MKSTERDNSRRELHWRTVKWCFFCVLVVAGLGLLLLSVTAVSHRYFSLGLLLFMLGCYWYGYDEGYSVGRYRGYQKGLAASVTQLENLNHPGSRDSE